MIAGEMTQLANRVNKELINVVWTALGTVHAGLAVSAPLARRYPAEVVPFAAIKEPTPEALRQLAELMTPGEETYIAWSEKMGGQLPQCSEVEAVKEIIALQMAPSIDIDVDDEPASGTIPQIERLTADHGPEMVALTDVAFPGFFRSHTYLMGDYWGIRVDGELISMAGERFALPGIREISAVCTHPRHTGRGYAARLIRHLLKQHADRGLASFLHVSDFNARAIALYEHLGFKRIGATRCTRIRKADR
jgi:ribosomal protein S18 acetylase RimI-like enzyme